MPSNMLTATRAMAKDHWLGLLEKLLNEIQGWTEKQHWPVISQDKQVTEKSLGTYDTRDLVIKAPGGTLLIEPVAHDVPNSDGRVDISSFPSMHRMLLIRNRGNWQLYTDSGVAWPKKWNRETFIEVAKILTTA